MKNALEQVQIDIFQRLLAAPYFADVGVFLFRPRAAGGLTEVQSQVDKNLAGLVERGGKTGACVMVMMPVASSQDPNVPGPRLTFAFSVRVIERPMVNMSSARGTLKPAEEISLEVLQQLHHFKPNPSFILVAGQPAIVPVTDAPDLVIYDVTLTQLTGLEKPLKAAAPVITQSLGTMVITVGVSESALYSLNGSYPSSPYTVPVVVTAGTQARALALRTGYQSSDISTKLIT